MRYKLLKDLHIIMGDGDISVFEGGAVFVLDNYLEEYLSSSYGLVGGEIPHSLSREVVENNPDWFEPVVEKEEQIKELSTGSFVIDPARKGVTTYIANVLEDDGTETVKKVNELVKAVNTLLKSRE